MVRKQLYVTEAQEAALKRIADEVGVSEAELVRRALDSAFAQDPLSRPRPGSVEAKAILRRSWSQSGSRLAGRFDRESLYDERLEQLAKRRNR